MVRRARAYALAAILVCGLLPIGAAAEITVTSIAPDRAGPTGIVRIDRLTGTGFTGDVEVSLVGPSSTVIAMDVSVIGDGELACTFDLWQAAQGAYAVRVAGANGVGELPGGFTVVDPEPEIQGIDPDHGPAGVQLPIEDIWGMNFTADVTVRVVGQGDDITAAIDDDAVTNHLTGTFDLFDATPGPHDIVVTTEYGESVLAGGFTVDEAAVRVVPPGDKFQGGGGCDAGSGRPRLWFLFLFLPLVFVRGRRRWPIAAAALVASLLVSALVTYADEIPDDRAPDVAPFVPTFDLTGFYGVHSPEPLGRLDAAIGAIGDAAGRPFVLKTQDGVRAVVATRATGWLGAALGATSWLDFGVLAPVVLSQTAGDNLPRFLEDRASIGLGDLRVGAKAMAVDPRTGPIGLAFLIEGTVPTGSPGDLFGVGVGTLGIGAVAGHRIEGFSVDYQAIYRFRLAPADRYVNLRLEDAFQVGVAADYRVARWARLFADLEAGTAAGHFFSVPEQAPVVVKGGARFLPHAKVGITVGGGAGLTTGVGAPDWTAFLGLTIFPARKHADGDRDGDGVPDTADACPDRAEDKDGFQDADGCPDPDNDRDGIPDSDDKCPGDPEDADNYQDGDGCPDPDNDGDGVLDVADRCPNAAEDFNGRFDDDGCPDASGPATLRVLPDRIVPAAPIRLNATQTDLDDRTKRTLIDLAAYLTGGGFGGRIRIEAHCDSSPGARQAIDWTTRLAQRIQGFLVERGVSPFRLEAAGLGATRPIASNQTARGREQNNRVEFILLGD
jgi:hypothetical protein